MRRPLTRAYHPDEFLPIIYSPSVDLEGALCITASITNEPVDDLKVAKGQKASAVIKASDVMISTD